MAMLIHHQPHVCRRQELALLHVQPGDQDFRSLALLREMAPVCLRSFVHPLSRAAVGECHPDPEHAPCDGPSQIDLANLDRLLHEVCAMQRALDTAIGGGAGGRA